MGLEVRERGNTTLRFIDRVLGIPLIFLFQLFKRKTKFPFQVCSIALLKSAGIGDIALLTGVIRDLKVAFPHAQLTLFTGSSNGEMGKMIEDIVVIPLAITRPFQAIKWIRKSTFDIWLDFDPWPRINAIFSHFSLSKWRVGFKTCGQHRHYLFDAVVEHRQDCHEIENYRRLVSKIGVIKNHPPFLKMEGEKEKCVVLHLFPGGSRAEKKMWDMDKWEKLAHELMRRGYAVKLTGGVEQREVLERFGQKLGSGCRSYAGYSLRETASLLQTSACLITVDTGIMHLGAIIGCYVVALHGPTSPNRWGGIGENVFFVCPPFEYKPCIHLGFEKGCKTNKCMGAISVERVLQAFERTLSRGSRSLQGWVR